MKSYLVCVLALAQTVPFAAGSSPLQVAKNVRVDVMESVPARDIWNTLDPKIVGRGDVIVDLRAFDPEVVPRIGKWYGCAIVMVGTRDLGIQPVTVRVWTTRPCDAEVVESDRPTSKLASMFKMQLGEAESITIDISTGLDVMMNGKAVGKITD